MSSPPGLMRTQRVELRSPQRYPSNCILSTPPPGQLRVAVLNILEAAFDAITCVYSEDRDSVPGISSGTTSSFPTFADS